MDHILSFTHPILDDGIIQEVTELHHSGWITSGSQVLAFEEEFNNYLRDIRTAPSFMVLESNRACRNTLGRL